MTYDLPGVTRDRHYGIMSTGAYGKHNSQDIIVVDTGGFYPEEVEISETIKKKHNYDPFFNVMREQAEIAISESDVILFVVDVREGLLPFDKMICDYLRRQKKPCWLLVNKFDTDNQVGHEADFYSLGIKAEDMILTSAEHNRGITDITERLCAFSSMKKNEIANQNFGNGSTPNHEVVASVAIIGAPNVGKSTLLNQLLEANRALVSNIAGTTVDPIEGYFDLRFGRDVLKLTTQDNEFYQHNVDLLKSYYEFLSEASSTVDEQVEQVFGSDSDDDEDSSESEHSTESEETLELTQDINEIESSDEGYDPADQWRSIKIVDTAGIRKSKLIHGHIESQSIYRSLRAITDCDIVIYMVDSTKGITHQDRRLLDIALDKGKSIVICLNKIDLMNEIMQNKDAKKEWIGDLRHKIPWLEFCELIPLSALKGSHLKLLKGTLIRTLLIRNEQIPTGKLNKAIETLVARNPVTVANARGVKLKIKYASQVKSDPPTFMLFSNKSQGIPDNFRKYMVNGIRREFGLINTPVHLVFRTTAEMKKNLSKKHRLDYQELT